MYAAAAVRDAAARVRTAVLVKCMVARRTLEVWEKVGEGSSRMCGIGMEGFMFLHFSGGWKLGVGSCEGVHVSIILFLLTNLAELDQSHDFRREMPFLLR